MKLRLLFGRILLYTFFSIMTIHAEAQSLLLPHMRLTDASGEKLIFFSPSTTSQSILPQKIRLDSHLQDILFYWILGLFFLLGIIKTLYGRYLENFTKVIFNSTLRQSQLLDQLNQSRRPSFYLNLLFLLSFSTYLSLIIAYHQSANPNLNLFLLCNFFVLVAYSMKSIFISILGWISGFIRPAGNYLSVFWMMNKATGLLCLMWLLLLAFSPSVLLPFMTYASIFTMLTMILIRYVRIYGSIRYDISMSRGQVLWFVISLEFIPILLVYKCFMQYFIKIQ